MVVKSINYKHLVRGEFSSLTTAKIPKQIRFVFVSKDLSSFTDFYLLSKKGIQLS